MARKSLSCVAALAVVLTMAVGCGSGSSDTGAPAPSVPPPSSAAPTTPAAPSDEPSTEPEPTPSASKPATPAPSATDDGKLKRGEEGAAVVALQKRLTELGYWNGKADGSFGSLTQQAVFALQKAAGLSRDGVVGPKTQKALEKGVRPKAKSTSGHVIEINKKRQLLMIVDNGEISKIFNTSTGSYEHYEYEGNTYLAATPSGKFTVSRQIDGWRDAPLGLLWRPKYFNGGIAVHGAYNVPPYGASHGCARLSISAMNWIWSNDKMPVKTKVWVY
jgi:peptidoglycan hydrolase-like protein with peptidoglycan-binding domain